jgi:hypothetical protein
MEMNKNPAQWYKKPSSRRLSPDCVIHSFDDAKEGDGQEEEELLVPDQDCCGYHMG